MLPQYRLHTDFSKEAYAENLAKIASELSILEQFSKVIFLCPICHKNGTPLNKILCCLNIGFILTSKEAYAENFAKIASELSFLELI